MRQPKKREAPAFRHWEDVTAFLDEQRISLDFAKKSLVLRAYCIGVFMGFVVGAMAMGLVWLWSTTPW